MPKPQKTPGGAKAAEIPVETPAVDTPPEGQPPEGGTPNPEPEPAPTPEEIEAQTQATIDAVFGSTNSAVNAKIQAERQKEADEPKPAEDLPQTASESLDPKEGGEKSEDGDKPAEAPAEPAAEPEPEKPAERFVPQMTPEQVQAHAREAAREEIASRDSYPEGAQPAPEVPHGTPANDEAGLSDEAQDHLMILKKMAALNPAHRDLPHRQKEFWKKEEKHRAQWEQANPGQSFNPNAEEHATFYAKNEPFVPKKDFKAAERAIIVDDAKEQAKAEVRREQEPRLREMELKELERQVQPSITNSVADAAEEVFAAAPEFAETFKKGRLSAAEVAKMEEINPALAKIAKEKAEETAVLVGELEKLDRLKGHYQVDPAKRVKLSSGETIAPHAVLEVEFAETEAKWLAKPEAERTRDGKKLIPCEKAMERAQRIHQDTKMRPDQKQRAMEDLTKGHWWVQANDVAKHIREKKAGQVGDFAKHFAKMPAAQPKSGATNGHPANGAPATNGKPAQTTVKPSGKAGLKPGTSTASASDVADNSRSGRNEAEKARENLLKSAFP